MINKQIVIINIATVNLGNNINIVHSFSGRSIYMQLIILFMEQRRVNSKWSVFGICIYNTHTSNIGGGKGGARGLKPPLRMISHRNYLSWSGAENRDKDRDTLIEQSL